jgi:hypothetical protein
MMALRRQQSVAAGFAANRAQAGGGSFYEAVGKCFAGQKSGPVYTSGPNCSRYMILSLIAARPVASIGDENAGCAPALLKRGEQRHA